MYKIVHVDVDVVTDVDADVDARMDAHRLEVSAPSRPVIAKSRSRDDQARSDPKL